jgi:hypothetical protein
MDLELASTEDMIAELGRRGLVAALVVSHVLAKDSVPSPGLPMCGAKKVYFTDGTDAKCPTARGAAFLCVGIVSCFDEILGSRQRRHGHGVRDAFADREESPRVRGRT